MPPRNKTENVNADEAPPPAIPLGTQADVTVKYKTQVDPNQDTSARRLSELDELAALADESEAPPIDEVTYFCERWKNFAGQTLSVVRLPDPPERRLAGNSYAHPCFNLERLGDTTFDPDNLISTLQFINRNSGGVFRVWLSYNGAAVPEARIERLAIGDPPGSSNASPLIPQQIQPAPLPPPPLPQKSEAERQLESVKDQLFTTALQRALNPTQQPQQVNGQPALPPDQQAMLYMLGNTDFVGQMFTKLADLAQQTAGVTKEPSLKERALDAGVEILSKNPAIIDRVSGIADRIIGRIFGPDPRYDAVGAPPVNQQPIYNQAPAYMPTQPQPQYQQAPPPDLTENSKLETENSEDTDEEVMDILEQLTTLLNSNTPLTLSDPTLISLRQEYPLKFGFAVRMIAKAELDDVVDWIKLNGGPLYVSLLDGPASGPFLRSRLGELQTLIKEGVKNATQQQQQAQQQQQTTKPDNPPIADESAQSPGIG